MTGVGEYVNLVPCGKVRLDILSKPNASLSLSAMDFATMVNGKEGNIQTWMLLSSEVKGYIAHPEYYFENDDREHRIAADLLMMVQGWRRYRWDLMAGNEQFKRIYNIEDKLYINGVLLSNPKDKQQDGTALRAYLFNQYGEWLYGDCVTDSAGGYAFAFPDVTGEWNLRVAAPKARRTADARTTTNNHRVMVDGPSYKGRPVVWIVNGAYRLVTGLNKEIKDFEVLRPTTKPLPRYMDEARCVYITEPPQAFHSYVRCPVLEKKKSVTVFITTHQHFVWDDSVLFSTFFDGFSE